MIAHCAYTIGNISVWGKRYKSPCTELNYPRKPLKWVDFSVTNPEAAGNPSSTGRTHPAPHVPTQWTDVRSPLNGESYKGILASVSHVYNKLWLRQSYSVSLCLCSFVFVFIQWRWAHRGTPKETSTFLHLKFDIYSLTEITYLICKWILKWILEFIKRWNHPAFA